MFNLVHSKDFSRKYYKPFIAFVSYTSTNFSKYACRAIINNKHCDSLVIFEDSVICGEDPRVFQKYLLSQQWEPELDDFKQNIVNMETKEVTEYRVVAKNFKYGKNWTPFIYNEKLYIIHKFDPLTIIKDGHIISEYKTNLPTNIDRVNVDTFCMYRGGTNGLQRGSLVFGFGHANESMEKHTPFLWVIDTKNNTFEHAILTDFPHKHQIVDSTSVFEENGKYYLGIYESETHWIQDGEYECISKVYEFNFEDIYAKMPAYPQYQRYKIETNCS